MKNTFKLIGLIAMFAAIGLSMTAATCGGGGTTQTAGGSGGGGTFTLTDIPAEYNGKYAGTYGSSGKGGIVAGWQSMTKKDTTYSRISNGSVSIPMWVGISHGNPERDFKKYTGNDTLSGVAGFTVELYNSPNGDKIGDLIFAPVAFANGNAARSWSEGFLLR